MGTMVIGALALTIVGGARAESKAAEAEAIPAPSVLPPRLLAHPEVPYPSDAHGDGADAHRRRRRQRA